MDGGSSPHTRGARLQPENTPLSHRIIPAYAGSTTSGAIKGKRLPDHPRIRGEHTFFALPPFRPVGSSPHTRGALMEILSSYPGGRIIPAYAGSTTDKTEALGLSQDHPRIRGEHRLKRARGLVHEGSSPHTRGAPMSLFSFIGVIRIIPAYAGSTRYHCRTRRGPADHPRIRGEHVTKAARAG